MNIEALNVSLAAPQTIGAQKVQDTKTTLNNNSSFVDTLGNARAARTKDKPAIDKVKSILSQEGFTQDEIDSIKNLKDLKKLLTSKAKDGTLKTGDDLTNLLSMISSQLTGKDQKNFADIKDLLTSVVPEIKAAADQLVNSGSTADALKTFQDETDNILSSNKQAIEILKPEDLEVFKSALTNEISSAVSSTSTDLSIKIQNEMKSMLDKYESDKSVTEINPSLPDANISDLSQQGDVINIDTIISSTAMDITTSITKAVNSGATADALNLLQDETDNTLSSKKQTIQSLSSDDLSTFRAKLINEVKDVVSSADPEIASKITDKITLILDRYKTDSSVVKLNTVLPDVSVSTISKLQDLNGASLGDKSSPDSSILSKLVEPEKDSSSIDKVTNFMTQFTNTTPSVKTDVPQKMTIDINNVNADIVKSLNYMQQGNIKNLSVTITPKELGTIVINLIMQNGTMMASITASNKEAYNLINSNLPDISAKLQNLNVSVQDLSLNIYNQDTTFFKDGSGWQQQQQQQQQNNQNGNNKAIGILNEPEFIGNQSLLNSNVNILA